MKKFLTAAIVSIIAATTPLQQAHANPMVAAGWLWAAGAGGLLLGWLSAPAVRPVFFPAAYAAEPVAPVVVDPYANCRRIQARVQGRWRNVIVCD